MPELAPERLLRRGVLDGVRVLTAGDPQLGQACASLGASVAALTGELLDEQAVQESAARAGAADVLVCDAGSILTTRGGGPDGLRAALQASWNALRAVAGALMAPAGAGLVVLVAPAAGAGSGAGAARAALENLARTTSVEWARLGVRVVSIAPGEATSPGALASLVAFLASPAGAYYSGCVIQLGAVEPSSTSS